MVGKVAPGLIIRSILMVSGVTAETQASTRMKSQSAKPLNLMWQLVTVGMPLLRLRIGAETAPIISKPEKTPRSG